MFLIHSPRGMRCVDTWKEMLMCRDMGLTKAVGVSNFGIQQLEGRNTTKLLPSPGSVGRQVEFIILLATHSPYLKDFTLF